MLRGAGFPADALSCLSSALCAEAADRFLEHEADPAASSRFEETFRTEILRISQEIGRIAGWDRFREAVTWQNHQVVERAFDKLACEVSSPSPTRNRRQRRDEMTVASYLQRYCAKNDTIGFFGPVGWALLSDEGDVATIRPGPDFLDNREVSFENWGIDALAQVLAKDPAIWPWLPPRLKSGLALEAGHLHWPGGRTLQLSPGEERLLRACDGKRTAEELAECGPAGREEVLASLASLREAGALNWTLEVPLELNPERTLHRALERIRPQDLREGALAALAELEAGRLKIARAAGDAAALGLGMREIDETFTRLTGLPARHNLGMTYGARGLLYEDCRRDVDARFGPELLRKLEPLNLVLRSARWLSGELTRKINEHCEKVYAALSELSGKTAVDSSSLFGQVLAQLFPPQQREACFGPVERDFQDRWMRVLALPLEEGGGRYERTSSELEEVFDQTFGDAGPAWALARYFSPDVMIAAHGEEALRRGDFEVVLAELHASNTLLASNFVAQHPDPQELQRALAGDWGSEQMILPQVPKRKQTQRTSLGAVLPHFLRYEFADEAPGRPECRALPAADVLVEATPEGLRARTRDGQVSFEVIELFGAYLIQECSRMLGSLLPRREHLPRVKIDDLVIVRESWRFQATELDLGASTDSSKHFLEVRRWARRHGIPRFCFYKSPSEKKPFFLDLDSPIYVDIFAKLLRGADRDNSLSEPLVVSEMLPALDQIWLKDGDGKVYTCELRIAAFERL